MESPILYTILKSYMRFALFFYYQKIKVVGLNNIPKKGAVLFISNHPNALFDPLLIATNNVRSIHFLARASLFKNKTFAKFLMSIQIIPIYRKRDNVDTLAKNKTTFSKCVEIMHTEKTIYIAAEGSHNIQRRIRPLKKGFVHIILDTLDKYPKSDIQIIPVGLNYDSVLNYPSSAGIYYGKPINVKEYYSENDVISSTENLLKVVKNRLETLTTHIENTESYDKTINKLKGLNVDFLNPIETNKIIADLDNYSFNPDKSSVEKRKSLLYYLVVFNSIIPWLIWKKVEKGISEVEFISTLRFAIGVTLFPLFYIIQSLIINFLFGGKIALIYFVTSILLGLLLTKTSKT